MDELLGKPLGGPLDGPADGLLGEHTDRLMGRPENLRARPAHRVELGLK